MISLDKRTETATESLVSLLKTEQEKGNDLGELTAQVILAVDYSGSMTPFFGIDSRRKMFGKRSDPSVVQTVVERALALSLSGLDDDGEVPLHFFHHATFSLVVADKDNYEGLVDNWAKLHDMGGTAYAPVIESILKSTEGDTPALVLFVTDGDPGDREATEKLLIEASKRPIFWQFIGIGPGSMTFIEHLNNDPLPGRVVDNVGVTIYRDVADKTDQEFYDDVIREFFSDWLPAARKAGITSA